MLNCWHGECPLGQASQCSLFSSTSVPLVLNTGPSAHVCSDLGDYTGSSQRVWIFLSPMALTMMDTCSSGVICDHFGAMIPVAMHK